MLKRGIKQSNWRIKAVVWAQVDYFRNPALQRSPTRCFITFGCWHSVNTESLSCMKREPLHVITALITQPPSSLSRHSESPFRSSAKVRLSLYCLILLRAFYEEKEKPLTKIKSITFLFSESDLWTLLNVLCEFLSGMRESVALIKEGVIGSRAGSLALDSIVNYLRLIIPLGEGSSFSALFLLLWDAQLWTISKADSHEG